MLTTYKDIKVNLLRKTDEEEALLRLALDITQKKDISTKEKIDTV